MHSCFAEANVMESELQACRFLRRMWIMAYYLVWGSDIQIFVCHALANCKCQQDLAVVLLFTTAGISLPCVH